MSQPARLRRDWHGGVDLTDSELIVRCLMRDEAAERAVYDRYLDRVYGLAYRLCGDADAAADHAQETFIRAFEHLGQFRGESSLGTWLGSIVVSVALNARRKTERIDRHRVELTDTIPTARAAAAPHDLRESLHAAIDRLSPKRRAVFVLHDVEGYTHDEIARILQIPSGTSKARLADARAALRVVLAPFHQDSIA